MKKQAGFTLVEIAIVMVIIGLLLGGVLKGQEIITNAKIRNLENEFQGVSAAMYSYQDRYNVFPGDDDRANRFPEISACPSADCGNRDGSIDGDFNSSTDTEESRLFWLHLRNAGLIKGNPTDKKQPLNKFNGQIGVSTGLDTGGVTIQTEFIGFTKVPQKVAIILDTRGDDGLSASGSIYGLKDDGTTSAADYVTDELYHIYFTL
jgi:prepilin-type N-terminal cleavage/methylation domain-containing protein